MLNKAGNRKPADGFPYMNGSVNTRARAFAFARVFLGIVWDFWREGRLSRRVGMRKAEERMAPRHRRRAIQFRETAMKMGGVLIKLGQFVGARVDIMPEPYIQELIKLQDEVPPEEFAAVKGLIETEFGRPLEEVYTSFNPVPEAAASLAQVHEAVLTNGDSVAVKVQRPGIERLIDIDLATFAYLMEGLKRFTNVGNRFDLEGLVEEFQRVLGEELDFRREVANAERFASDFNGRDDVRVPLIHHDYSTDRVITLERIQGVKVNDFEGLDAAGIDRIDVARLLVDVYVTQFLDTGFFHADPHPGNLFISPGPVITFVDFGMMGEITAADREFFVDAIVAITQKDPDDLIEAALGLKFIRQGANTEPIRNALAWLFERYSGLSTMKTADMGSLDSIQEDIRVIMRENPFTLPVHFAYVGKAFGTMIGLIAGLAPDFDIVEEAKPHVDTLTRQVRTELLLKQAKKIGLTVLQLPIKLDRVLNKVERGELKVRLTGQAELMDELRKIRTTSRANALSVIATGLVIGAAVLYVNQYLMEAAISAACAVPFAFGVLFTKRRRPRFHP